MGTELYQIFPFSRYGDLYMNLFLLNKIWWFVSFRELAYITQVIKVSFLRSVKSVGTPLWQSWYRESVLLLFCSLAVWLYVNQFYWSFLRIRAFGFIEDAIYYPSWFSSVALPLRAIPVNAQPSSECVLLCLGNCSIPPWETPEQGGCPCTVLPSHPGTWSRAQRHRLTWCCVCFQAERMY